MKRLLSIEENDFAEISKEKDRVLVKLYNYMLIYKRDCGMRKTHSISFEYAELNQSYINSLFKLIGYLYNYYEVSSKHFELLSYAATNLERLYATQINDLPLEMKLKKIEELSCYLNKVALIFEIASDRMEIPDEPESGKQQGALYRQTYITLSQEYSKKADELLGITWNKKHHIDKMLFLCDEIIATIDPKRDFFREPFRVMANKYREKCAREAEAQDARKPSDQDASATGAETETTPLLGTTSSIPRSGSDGLLTKAKDAVMSLTSFFQKAPKKDEPAHRAARAASAPVIEIDSEKNISEPHRRNS